MKTLLVGGAGFIGHYVTTVLQNSGREVCVTGTRAPSEVSLPQDVQYIQSGTTDVCPLEGLSTSFDEIIDLAYASVPKSSYDDPVRDISDNLPRFVKLLDFVAQNPCRKFIFLSTGGAIYGQAQSLPITEDHPLNPISPYGITKMATEKYAFMYSAHKQLPCICLRPGNVYGAGQVPFRGQGLIATIMGCILKNKPFSLYGGENTIRDYIHAEDTAKAILAVLNKGVVGETYNVGRGIGVSNVELLRLIETKRPAGLAMPPVEQFPERHFDVHQNILDPTKIQRDTGWEPEVPLEEGIEQAFEWLQKEWLPFQ